MFPVFTQVLVWLLWLAVRFRRHDRCLFHYYVPCFPQLGRGIIGSVECNFVRLSRFSSAALCFRSLFESFAFDTCGSRCDSQLNVSPAGKPRPATFHGSWSPVEWRINQARFWHQFSSGIKNASLPSAVSFCALASFFFFFFWLYLGYPCSNWQRAQPLHCVLCYQTCFILRVCASHFLTCLMCLHVSVWCVCTAVCVCVCVCVCVQ